MRHLGELREDANESALIRGHAMEWTPPHHSESTSLQQATCRDCQAWLQLNTTPRANGIDIGGPAVAMDSPVDPKWL